MKRTILFDLLKRSLIFLFCNDSTRAVNLAFFTIVLPLIVLFFGCNPVEKKTKSHKNILILTGQNNHEWQFTTDVLLKMYKKLPDYQVTVTEDPESLTYEDIKTYDVLVSNWNNWPENGLKWDPVQEAAFLKYVEEGGGIVTIHAGGSSYYDSDVYQQISIGRWGEETSHGQPTMGKIHDFDQTHPITSGLGTFYILDELWEKTDIYPGASVLARVSGKDEGDGHDISEQAVFVNEIGKGRCFYTILGHDERAFFNTGLQTLLLRATEWAASGEVTYALPQDLREEEDLSDNFIWEQSDTTLQLRNGHNLVWQYNFRNRFGKSYFHPVYQKNARLTCESPRDHVWHYGLWFSWKFINGLNYWEYTNDHRSEEAGFRSEGKTNIESIKIVKNQDYSANLTLEILYHPEPSGEPVLSEQRSIYISRPGPEGYYFDYEHHFLAEFGDVTIDRTPILGEPDGKSWGGYGGLSIRCNQDFTAAETIPEYPPVTPPGYPKNGWFYMGFNTLSGEQAGMAIFQHPDYTTPSTRWYYLMDSKTPFFFFSPAAVYDRNIQLRKDDLLVLKYRIWILPGANGQLLEEKYHQYIYE
jgi:type 1 glutamine amidotransferase